MQDNMFSPSVEGKAVLKVNSFIKSVYNWMTIGLFITAFTALFTVSNEALLQMIIGRGLFLFLIIAELGLVFFLVSRISKMKAQTATLFFIIYSALNGLTLAPIFLMYTQSSIFSTFLICALTFAACSLYGMTTNKDLTSIGSFMMMGLFGIIIASVINMFLRSSGMSVVISYIGVVVFVGLTAYDTQKLKQMALTQPDNIGTSAIRKGAILGALTLYLDFINLFIMLLRIFGDRRN